MEFQVSRNTNAMMPWQHHLGDGAATLPMPSRQRHRDNDVIAGGFCSLYAAVQSPSHFTVFMWVYMFPLARHKVMVFLEDWFISVDFKSLR